MDHAQGVQLYALALEQVEDAIAFLLDQFQANQGHEGAIGGSDKDVVILDYLITCKQLLDMIHKDLRASGRENYEKFARKSRI